MELQVGQKAPDFALPSLSGEIKLGDLNGKWVIIYFYPKDNTPGCTKQAREFKENHASLGEDVVILGVSKDNLTSHDKFSKKYELPFLLLSDEDTKVSQSYGTWGQKKFMGVSYMGLIRSTFLIDPKGLITKTWYSVKVFGHVAEVIETLQAQRSGS